MIEKLDVMSMNEEQLDQFVELYTDYFRDIVSGNMGYSHFSGVKQETLEANGNSYARKMTNLIASNNRTCYVHRVGSFIDGFITGYIDSQGGWISHLHVVNMDRNKDRLLRLELYRAIVAEFTKKGVKTVGTSAANSEIKLLELLDDEGFEPLGVREDSTVLYEKQL